MNHNDPSYLEGFAKDGERRTPPVVHPLRTRGGSQCGAEGDSEAEINLVTCDACRAQHDAVTLYR